MNTRRGVTLTEVLMAIFVMGIGMISLLVLFPVGMHNMVQAIKNDRVGVASTSATNFAELLSLRRDDYVVGDPNNPTLRVGSMYYLLGAAPSFMPAVPAVPQPAPLQPPYLMGGSALNGWWVYQYYPNAPSPPVFVDPVGGYAYPQTGAAQIGYGIFPGGQVNFGVPRSDVSLIANAPLARRQEFLQRWFTQGDDLGFDEFGQPFPADPNNFPPAVNVERDRAYSWAYVRRRPRFRDPETVELTVVIFKNRKIVVDTSLFPDPPDVAYRGPLQQDPGSNQLVFRPVFLPYSASMDPSMANGFAKELQRPNTAIIGWNPTTQTQPAIKRGDWLFDATMVVGLPPYRVASPTNSSIVPPPSPTPAQLQVPFTPGNVPNLTLPPEYPPPYFNAYFYKVVGVSEPLQPDLSNPNELQIHLELDRPVRNVGFACVVLPDVVDVIEKSDGLKTQTTTGP